MPLAPAPASTCQHLHCQTARATADCTAPLCTHRPFAGSKVQLLYSNIFSFASVHWGRGFGGVPDGAPDGACGEVDRSRSL
ncbi:unnamed protein product [Fusarium venenatum]|uniref:Uncharacterized protein n=1 Tax=Fusarium venenatum TaxID=56646 RepID=A0A2L2T1V8_9HYPO|nr:uncharacterized protein FVRRES_01114 [Fusarium venenatum]CEI64602.1 unnamed protein product [Fusarium venenatum]